MTGTPFTRVLFLFVVGLAVSLAGAGTAGAGLGVACPDPITYPFLNWGDHAKYAAAPNNGFEAGATSWTLSGGAKVVAGNESFYVRAKSDRYSLSRFRPGSRATSAPMCVSLLRARCASSPRTRARPRRGSMSRWSTAAAWVAYWLSCRRRWASRTSRTSARVRAGSAVVGDRDVGGVLPLLTSHV